MTERERESPKDGAGIVRKHGLASMLIGMQVVSEIGGSCKGLWSLDDYEVIAADVARQTDNDEKNRAAD